jgi:hypothetical protein
MVSMTELIEQTKWSQKKSGTPIVLILLIVSKNFSVFAALLDFRRIVPPPSVFDLFQPLNLASPSIDPVTVDCRAGFGIATAFGVVIFAENELKVRAGRLFGDVRNTIP